MPSNIWDRLSVTQKRVTTITSICSGVVMLVGLVWTGTSLLATDTELNEAVSKVKNDLNTHIEQQVIADNRSTIQRAKAEIRQIDFQLLDEGLPYNKRTFLEQSKEQLKELINCVQDGKSLCDQ